MKKINSNLKRIVALRAELVARKEEQENLVASKEDQKDLAAKMKFVSITSLVF